MSGVVEFEVLGPVRLRGADGMVEPAGRLQRILLSVLLVRANEPVSVDVLADALWHGELVARATQKVQLHVHKLRSMLDDRERIAFGPSGYRLLVRPGELDVERFTTLVDTATELAGTDPARCADLLREALGYWRGAPYEGLDTPMLVDEAGRLADQRLVALELRFEAELDCGWHAAAATELSVLAAEYPLRERLVGLLMTALHRDGRQAEALEIYRRTRKRLVDELGLEPGPALRAVERRVLSGEPDAGAPVDEPGRPVPAQLPHNVRGFVGRDTELSELDTLLDGAQDAPITAAVVGTAGVGKTALAVRWAHRVRDRFPDGQLYIDLRGYGPADPVAPEDALGGFLRALGVDGGSLPAEPAERSARFRTLVDGRRMVLVLDNARTVEQVRLLLPGSSSVAVLVTSRDSLAGLVARDGAHRIGLGRLPRSESVDLLTRLAGDRTGGLAGPVGELVELCARLPLALRVAGELIRSRRGHSVQQLVTELVDEQRRLDLLDSDGDPHTAVRAVFSWSYQNLTEPDAWLFRLCGVHPGRDVDAYAMAAMTGGDLRSARRSLDALARAHLIEEVRTGRYQMHDLLRAYAAELAEETEHPDEGRAATVRLRDFYLHTAALASEQVSRLEAGRQPVDHPPAEAPCFAGYDEALSWLDDELGNLLAAADLAAPRYVTGLSVTVWRYLDIRGHYDDAVALHSQAVRAARGVGDRLAEGNSLRILGAAYHRMALTEEAARHTEQALHLYRDLGERTGEAAAVNNLAAIHFEANRFREVVPLSERSVELFRASGEEARLASALANLASVQRTLGDYAEATSCLEEAVVLAEKIDDRNMLVYPVHGLAHLYSVTGRPHEAKNLARRALAIARENGNRTIEGEAIYNLGRIHRQLGEREQALRYQHEALEMARTTDDRILISMALVEFGHTHRETGELEAAQACYREALEVAADGARPLEEADAHDGLGDVHAALGDPASARDQWRRALAIYTGLGVPQAGEARAKLDGQPVPPVLPPGRG